VTRSQHLRSQVLWIWEFPGSPSSLSLPIDWGQVKGNAEQAWSWVEATSRLLWEAMAMANRDVLHLIRVSSKKKKEFT
jgi:hypothetical protein